MTLVGNNRNVEASIIATGRWDGCMVCVKLDSAITIGYGCFILRGTI